MKNCSNCDGKCCKYVVIQIDNPETLEDFENIKWFLCHKNVNVFVDEDNDWHVEFLTPCEFLGENNLCGIYDKRPAICREYAQDECPFHNEYSEKYTFNSLEDLEGYIKNVWKKNKN
jgi:Fe-S-cluster containining protein